MTSKNLIELYSFELEDRDIIKCQINTNSVYLAGIVERCKYGFPSIFLICPIPTAEKHENDDEKKRVELFKSIANVIWLSCPYLNKKIHDIESKGNIRKIQDFIQNDRELVEGMENAHAHYYFLRKHIYKHYYENDIVEKNIDLFNVGIGGMKSAKNIKCLHMHYAHFRLYNQNTVGKIVYELLDEKIYCKENDCKKCFT